MTILNQPVKEWSKHNGGKDDPAFNSCSPNLLAIAAEMHQQWPAHGEFYGIHDLGCYGERDIRGSTTQLSAHSCGAATDQRYTDAFNFSHFDANRTLCLNVIIPWLITNSLELHLDAIHDYVGGRIWHSARTANIGDAFTAWWKPNTGPGMGSKASGWLHLETTLEGWHDATPVAKRPLTFQPTTPVPAPTPPILEDDDMNLILWRDLRFNNAFRVLDSAITVTEAVVAHDKKNNVDYIEEIHDQMLISCMASAHLKASQMVANAEHADAAAAFLADLPSELK